MQIVAIAAIYVFSSRKARWYSRTFTSMATRSPHTDRRHRVLLVEDDDDLRVALARALRQLGLVVFEADRADKAMQLVTRESLEVVVTDLRLPDADAIQWLPRLRTLPGAPSVVILTGHGSIDLAVQAVHQGADNFLTKPVEAISLAACVRAAVERRGLDRSTPKPPSFEWRSPEMRSLEECVMRLQGSDCSVLVLGETGTGKSQLARTLHENSPRSKSEFVDINCAGLHHELLESELFGHERGAFTGAHASKPGLFELAEGGTVFFDEIGDLDLAVQPKVLKVVEEKRFRRMGEVRSRSVDVRLVAATHHDLLGEVQAKRFRADLFYRVSTITLNLPPLRKRRKDLLRFAEHLLTSFAPSASFDEQARELLSQHRWPGNLREMRNVIERAVLLRANDVVCAQDIVFDERPAWSVAPPPPDIRSQGERDRIRAALDAEDGHVGSAARRLGIPRSTLYQKIKALGLPLRR